MMNGHSLLLVLFSLILLSTSAPIADKKDSSLSDKGSKVEVKSTDEDDLHKLSAPKATKQGLKIIKTESVSENMVNGHKESTSNVETKVLKPGTNKVIADVMVKSKGHQNKNEAPKVETEVDIPDQGIAEMFEGAGEEMAPARNPMDFTPRAVAEYLLVSGDLDGFFNALQELVAAKAMTIEDAKKYEMAVEQEYQMLLLDLERPEETDYYDNLQFNQEDKRAEDDVDDMNRFNLDSMAARENLQNALDKEEAYAELAQALVEEYIENSEAREPEPYDNMLDDMNSEDVEGVIGLLADALVSEELNEESQKAVAQPEVPSKQEANEEMELDEIAKTMGQVPDVEEKMAEARDQEEAQKKNRTSEEDKETDDKKEKKANAETLPAKKST